MRGSYIQWTFAAVLISAAANACAQLPYYNDPGNTIVTSTTPENSVTLNITQVHTAADTLQFNWERIQADLPDGWTATICDNVNCYPDLALQGQTAPVLPGDDGLMLIHCTPSAVQGTAVIRYVQTEFRTQQPPDTLTWMIHAEENLSIPAAVRTLFSVSGNTISCTPELLSATPLLECFDITGRIVAAQQLSSEMTTITFNELPSGIHILRFSGKGINIRQQLWIYND